MKTFKQPYTEIQDSDDFSDEDKQTAKRHFGSEFEEDSVEDEVVYDLDLETEELADEEQTVEGDMRTSSAEVELDAEEEEEVDDEDDTPASDLDIEVEDDTPEEDKGREASEPPKDLSDEELEKQNSVKDIKNRLKHFSKGYHDERRAKETAQRERQAAIDDAKRTREKIKELQERLNNTSTDAFTAKKQKLESDYAEANVKYKQAYDSGDSEALQQANEQMIDLKFKIGNLQEPVPEVIEPEPQYEQPTQQEQPQQEISPRLRQWATDNPWFNNDLRMTQVAHKLDAQIQQAGIQAGSDQYFTELDKQLRRTFPSYPWTNQEAEQPTQEVKQKPVVKKKANPAVMPTTRSNKPRKVKLTASQVKVANDLGISLEDYARELIAEQMKNQ